VITAAELALIPLLTGLDESARQRLAQKAADIRAEGGDWVIREGEDPRFFAVLEGLLLVVKDIVGQRRELEQLNAGEFFGEIPILLGTANLVSVQAVSRCRLARFDRQQLQELIRDFSSCGTTIFKTMTDRLSMAPQYVKDTPSSRVLLSRTRFCYFQGDQSHLLVESHTRSRVVEGSCDFQKWMRMTRSCENATVG
jgi:thioredoxin reductase (NADPH)